MIRFLKSYRGLCQPVSAAFVAAIAMSVETLADTAAGVTALVVMAAAALALSIIGDTSK